jgi:hypothetical protein
MGRTVSLSRDNFCGSVNDGWRDTGSLEINIKIEVKPHSCPRNAWRILSCWRKRAVRLTCRHGMLVVAKLELWVVPEPEIALPDNMVVIQHAPPNKFVRLPALSRPSRQLDITANVLHLLIALSALY